MKKWFLSLALIIGIISLTACGDDSEIVAETDAGNITHNDFYDEMKKAVGAQALTNLIYHEILPEKYEIDEKELEEQYNDFKSMYGDNFDMLLGQAGLSEDDIKRSIELELLMAEVEKVAMKNVEVTDEEIDDYYEKNYPKIHARHILVDDEDKANEIKSKLENGENFEELAKEHSTDPGSAQTGGDLKWFGPGEMVEEFSDAAFALAKNEISEPVKTEHGYHIIQVLDTEKKSDLKDVKEDITKDLRAAKFEEDPKYMNDALKKEMEDAGVKINDKDLKKILDE